MSTYNRNKELCSQLNIGNHIETNAHKVVFQSTLSGLSVPVKWALRDQAMGIDRPSDGHQLNKRRAFIAHAVFTECPKAERFLGTPCRSAALLLCIMPHDDFVILR